MKQALKRIEEALNQLETQKNAVNPQPDTTKPSYSFDIFLSPKSDFPQPQVSDSSRQTPKAAKAPELPYLNAASNTCLPAKETIEVSSLPEIIEDTDDRRTGEQRGTGARGARGRGENSLQNPSWKVWRREVAGGSIPPANFGDPNRLCRHASSRGALNPRTRQAQLSAKSKSQNSGALSHDEAIEQVVHQIQDLYHEGPIVDGYLEYYPPAPEQDDPTLREVCFERVIDRLEEVSNLTSGQKIGLPGASYRLCGVDASGQQWSYPCPLDQLPSVSMAIARYQKLQQLLQQKHKLEQNRVNKDEG
jgi:hypothetical protein